MWELTTKAAYQPSLYLFVPRAVVRNCEQLETQNRDVRPSWQVEVEGGVVEERLWDGLLEALGAEEGFGFSRCGSLHALWGAPWVALWATVGGVQGMAARKGLVVRVRRGF